MHNHLPKPPGFGLWNTPGRGHRPRRMLACLVRLARRCGRGGTGAGNGMAEVNQDVEGSEYQPRVFFRGVPTLRAEPSFAASELPKSQARSDNTSPVTTPGTRNGVATRGRWPGKRTSEFCESRTPPHTHSLSISPSNSPLAVSNTALQSKMPLSGKLPPVVPCAYL